MFYNLESDSPESGLFLITLFFFFSESLKNNRCSGVMVSVLRKQIPHSHQILISVVSGTQKIGKCIDFSSDTIVKISTFFNFRNIRLVVHLERNTLFYAKKKQRQAENIQV